MGKRGILGYLHVPESARLTSLSLCFPCMQLVLLKDAVKQLDEPFLVAVVGEFNSGKSRWGQRECFIQSNACNRAQQH